MARLLTLPNEVLRMIIGQVMPEDLENFAQTSKHIQSVSASAVRNHRRLIRKYKQVSGRATVTAVERLLKSVLANPRIGHYVKKVEICGDADEYFEKSERSEEVSEIEDGSMNIGVDTPEEALSLD